MLNRRKLINLDGKETVKSVSKQNCIFLNFFLAPSYPVLVDLLSIIGVDRRPGVNVIKLFFFVTDSYAK